MDWTELGLRDRVIEWLELAAAARYARDRRLDPFATSMRDFDDASDHLKAIRSGNPPSVEDAKQRITDLKNAGLVVEGGGVLTPLGMAVLEAWEQFDVDTPAKADEFSRLLLMAFEARRIDDEGFRDFFSYWKDLRTHFDPFELIDSWDALYAINYLDYDRGGFAPGLVYRDKQVGVPDIEFDLGEYARKTGASAQAVEGGERIENAIGSKVPRGRHRATFCMALETVLSDGLSASRILQEFGHAEKPRLWTPFDVSERSKVGAILDGYGAAKPLEELVAVEGIAADTPAMVGKKKNLAYGPLPALAPDIDFSDVLVDPPKPKAPVAAANDADKASPAKLDYTEKAKVNDAIGSLGEDFAFAYERWRLRNHPGLREKVRHVSKEDDSLGYDIESFETDGSERYVEVKATLGPLESRFFLTSNEIACAEYIKERYVILRVANLASNPICCEIRFPFDEKIDIKPAIYLVRFRTGD